jgi:hypothetical protein
VTLDPVHVDNIARLAGAIADNVDDADHDAFAATVWSEWLDPLRRGGRTVLEPLGERRRRSVDTEAVALAEPPFPSVHGLDSGTMNPTTFKNGLVLDVAQAAMGAVPSDLDLHRARSLVATVHTNDATVRLPEDWVHYDEGYSRRRILQAPRVSRFAEEVVHELALYLAEVEHAHHHAGVVEDLLVLDGPLYPKRLLNWEDRDRELGEVAREATPRNIVTRYVRLVETFVERDVPVVGFVKNPTSGFVVRTLREKGVTAPWPDDTALFSRLLERRRDGERDTDDLTFTSWFRSRGGADEPMAADGDALGIDRRLDPAAYETTFFVLYDPRSDLLYRIEAPYAVTRDEATREALTTQVLRDVAAARGPPEAVGKADELARIGRAEKTALRRKMETTFGTEHLRTYDEERWRDD